MGSISKLPSKQYSREYDVARLIQEAPIAVDEGGEQYVFPGWSNRDWVLEEPVVLRNQEARARWGMYYVQEDIDEDECEAQGRTHGAPNMIMTPSTADTVHSAIKHLARNRRPTPHIFEAMADTRCNLFIDLRALAPGAIAGNVAACNQWVSGTTDVIRRFLPVLSRRMTGVYVGVDASHLQFHVLRNRHPLRRQEGGIGATRQQGSSAVPEHDPPDEFLCRVLVKHPRYMFEDLCTMDEFLEEALRAFEQQDANGGHTLRRLLLRGSYRPDGCASPSSSFLILWHCQLHKGL